MVVASRRLIFLKANQSSKEIGINWNGKQILLSTSNSIVRIRLLSNPILSGRKKDY